MSPQVRALQVHEVFTPFGCAPHAVADRPFVAEVRASLVVPVRQLLLHGPSAARKTTAAVRALARTTMPVLTTRLRGGHADALAAIQDAPGLPRPREVAARAPRGIDDPTAVAAWLLEHGAAGLLEEVHKPPPTTQAVLGEVLRRCAAAPGQGRVVELGLDPAFPADPWAGPLPLHRIAVATMTAADLDAMLVAGAARLHVHIPAAMRAAVIEHASGHPSACHGFALNLCLAAGVAGRAVSPVTVDTAAFETARARTPICLL